MSYQDRSAPASTALVLWRDHALAKSVGTKEDFDSDAAAAFVDAAESREIPRILEASEVFGAYLASTGTPISEGLGILHSFFELPNTGGGSSRVVDAFVEGWVNDTLKVVTGSGVTDDVTGLRTRDYLTVRLAEIYAEAAARNETVNASREFLVLTRPGGKSADATVWWHPRRAVLADSLSGIFNHGETVAALPERRLVVVAFHDWLHDGQLKELQAVMREQSRVGGYEVARLELLTPPNSFDNAKALLKL